MRAAARVKVAAAEEVAAAPIVPAVVATAAVADLLAAVGDATEGATSRRNAPGRRVTYSPSELDARVWPRVGYSCESRRAGCFALCVFPVAGAGAQEGV